MFVEVEEEVVGPGYEDLVTGGQPGSTLPVATATPQVGAAKGRGESEQSAVVQAAGGVGSRIHASAAQVGAAALMMHHLRLYPEHNHLITEARTSSNVPCAVLYSILAVLPSVMPSHEIPTLAELQQCQRGPLQPSVGEYVRHWNQLRPASQVSEPDVWSVLALVLQKPMTWPAETTGAADVGGGAAVNDIATKLQRLVMSLQECGGKLDKGMIRFAAMMKPK